MIDEVTMLAMVDAAAGDGALDDGAPLLQRIGRELSDLVAGLGDLQEKIMPVVFDAANTDHGLIGAMQGFDHIEQVLGGLSRVLAIVGSDDCRLHPGALRSALDSVTLADLRRRLGDGAPLGPDMADDLDLFPAQQFA